LSPDILVRAIWQGHDIGHSPDRAMKILKEDGLTPLPTGIS
jgi:hypothetical protein